MPLGVHIGHSEVTMGYSEIHMGYSRVCIGHEGLRGLLNDAYGPFKGSYRPLISGVHMGHSRGGMGHSRIRKSHYGFHMGHLGFTLNTEVEMSHSAVCIGHYHGCDQATIFKEGGLEIELEIVSVFKTCYLLHVSM